MVNTFGQPQLPPQLLHPMYELRAPEAVYDPDNGGQYIPQEPERIRFDGAVLPLTEKDWRQAPEGAYTKDSCKVYANGYELAAGARILDTADGYEYTVTGPLEYGLISKFKRYIVERKGKAAPR